MGLFSKKSNAWGVGDAWILTSQYNVVIVDHYNDTNNNTYETRKIQLHEFEFYFPTYSDAVKFKGELESKGKSYMSNVSFLIANVAGISLLSEDHTIEKVRMSEKDWNKKFSPLHTVVYTPITN